MVQEGFEESGRYITRDDPVAAQVVARRIQGAVNLLSDNPALGHPGRIHNTRELIVPNTHYVIPYRVRIELERIEILRVFHTSRRLPGRW
jgi:toxin ParE1/3/4